MNFLKTSLVAASMIAAGVISAPSNAATDTTTFQVKIIITESCDIHTTAATSVDFGTSVRSKTTATDAAGNLVVNCSKGTPYTIGLNNGANEDGTALSATNRRMINGTNYVPYGLYSDTGRSALWGNTVASSVAGVGTAANVSVPVYGRVAIGSTNVPTGTYLDTVTATVTY